MAVKILERELCPSCERQMTEAQNKEPRTP